MEKKYQVFISGTFLDLEKERNAAIQAVLRIGWIPIGMELFPAANEDQWSLIQRVIKESDYYVLIVGGRYGSIEEESGLSYTHKEYQYAMDEGIPIISFIKGNIDELPDKMKETTKRGKRSINRFRSIVMKKLCKFFQEPTELYGEVALSLMDLANKEPRPGWVRGDNRSYEELYKEIAELRKDNEELEREIEELEGELSAKEYSSSDPNRMLLLYEYRVCINDEEEEEHKGQLNPSWIEIFLFLHPKFVYGVRRNDLRDRVNNFLEIQELDKLSGMHGGRYQYVKITSESLSALIEQLRAWRLVKWITRETGIFGGKEYYLTLTEYGKKRYKELHEKKRQPNK